ncbi:MAG: dihydrodipicolinate reductase, partial [Myxococcales bacterium]
MDTDRDPIRVLHVGLGQIGAAIARAMAGRADLESVAAFDPGLAVAGKTLDEICGDGVVSLPVRGDLGAALVDGGGPQVALHAVASRILDIEPQLVALARAGLNVVTTAEELIYPRPCHSEATARIDAAAREAGVTIFAAGVNPGMLMDRLPIYLSSLCIRVSGVRVG